MDDVSFKGKTVGVARIIRGTGGSTVPSAPTSRCSKA